MRIILGIAASLCLSAWAWGAQEILIVADEFPAMEILARQLKARGGPDATIVRQEALPDSLKPYPAVVVYIHGQLQESTERALVAYTKEGGRLLALYHSISSGKRKVRCVAPLSIPATISARRIVQAERQTAMTLLSFSSVLATLSASMAMMITGKKATRQIASDPSQGAMSRAPTITTADRLRINAMRAYMGSPR